MMRPAAALLLALAALAALPAGKPLPPSDNPPDTAADARLRMRGQAISLCVAELRPVPDLSPDDLESICGCAVDRYLTGLGGRPDPQVRLQGALETQMVACTARIRPERAGDVARRRVAAQQTAAPPVAEAPVADAPATDGKPDVAEETTEASVDGEEAGGSFWAWLGTLALPAWLTGASILWWIAGGIFLFGLLLMKLQRRDPRNDLVGPPAHLRRGAPPQPPRRPDLPR